MLNELFTSPQAFFIWAGSLLVAITIHEFAHAWMADHLGDPTPRLNGRLTLNPVAHLDPIGTLMLLFTRFGWGKPVPVDEFNLDNPRKDHALISLSGPAINLSFSLVLAIVLGLIGFQTAGNIILPLIIMNVSLGVFNLIPIPPLDGSKIVLGILPAQTASEWEALFSQYGTVLLILLILPLGGVSFASRIVSPITSRIISWFLKLSSII